MKGKVLTALAVVFSIIFVLGALAATLMGAVNRSVQPVSVEEIVDNIDYEELVVENDVISEVIEDLKVKDSAIDDIMRSDAVEEILDIYIDGITAELEGKRADEEFTPELLQEIVHDNIDEFIEIAEDNTKGEFNEEIWRERILNAVDEYAEDIVDYMPTVEDMSAELGSDTFDVVRTVFSSEVLIITAVCCALFLVLIYVCKYAEFKGLLWVGIDLGITGVLAAVAMSLISVIETVIIEETDGVSSAVEACADILSANIAYALIPLFSLAIIAIAAYIIIWALRKKTTDSRRYVEVTVDHK